MRVVAFILLTLLPHTWAEGELAKQLDAARNRMRCLSDAECLNEKGVLRLLRTTDFQKSHTEDLSIILAHHFLHGGSSCTVQIPSLEVVEEEVMRAIETEGIPGILNTFKRILTDGEKQECITTDGILKEMPPSSSSFTAMQWLRSVLSILIEHILKGHCINDGAHSEDSLDNLFNRYGDACSPFITAKGLEKMMTDLETARNDHHHHHSHHISHHEGHNHADCDHDHHGTSNHDHDNSGKYHNHDHTGHNHGNHGSLDQNHPIPYSSNHDHGDHSYHDHSKHNHADHDHNYHSHLDHDHGGLDHSDRDHSNHNLSSHDHSSHNHSDLDHSNHNHHSDHDHNRSLSKETSYKDHKNNQSNIYDLEVKIHSLIPTNHHSGNHNDSFVPENQTMEIETRYLTATPENNSETLESVLSSRLSDLWHPTTLASEESNIINNVIPPLQTTSSITKQCLSAESMVSLYGLDRITISKAEFLRLCPVIVQQTVGDACDEPHITPKAPSKIEVYGYSSACVFVLCLASLSGAILLPLMKRNVRHYVIAGFQGLAVSTMASDALLHLMPEFLGLHSHDHSHDHFHEEASFPEPYAQLLLGFLATTYVLFMIEAVLSALSGDSKEGGGHGHSHVHHVSEPTLISVKNKSITQLPLSGDQSCTSLNTEILDMDDVRKPPNLMVSQPVLCGLTSVALVVTLGDALHNFGDGLAIGAAFSANLRGGFSTAAAALCHELPHELGDFAVLLRTGMSFSLALVLNIVSGLTCFVELQVGILVGDNEVAQKWVMAVIASDFAVLLSTGMSFSRALVLNFVSGLTCFAGLYVGILVGDNEVARKWVMAVTASTFLYVALAEMIPELREHRYGSVFKMLLVKNVGIIVGVTIMCVISVYEHDML